MIFLYCLVAAFNGYVAVTHWPSPWCMVSAACCLWMLILAFKEIRSEK